MYAGVPYAPVAPAYSLLVARPHALGTSVERCAGTRLRRRRRALRAGAARRAAGGRRRSSRRRRRSGHARDAVRGARGRDAPTARRRRGARRVTAGHHRQGALHVRIDRAAQGRDQHAADAVREPGADPDRAGVPRGRAAGAVRLAAVEPHFGGNHNFGIVLYNGGTLYIDEGRPMPGAVRDARSPTCARSPTTAYFNVPRGYEMLVPRLRADADFARHFFSRPGAAVLAAAGLRPAGRGRDAGAGGRDARPARSRGSPAWARPRARRSRCAPARCSRRRRIGVPVPGVELKLAPVGDSLEARLRGPNITPGYWRDDELTRAAFDEEGFYRMGDAIAPSIRDDPSKGFTFRGRIDEDFKLSTGTWVRVGTAARAAPRRARRHRPGCRHRRARARRVGVLIFPNLPPAAPSLPHAAPGPAIADLRHAAVGGHSSTRLAPYNATSTGSSTSSRGRCCSTAAVDRRREITDKGSINQRAVLAQPRRAGRRLYRRRLGA